MPPPGKCRRGRMPPPRPLPPPAATAGKARSPMLARTVRRATSAGSLCAYSYQWSVATWTLSCTVLKIRRLKCRKSTIFPTPLLFPLKVGCVPFGVDPIYWALQRVKRLGYSAVKLLSKNSNLYNHDTSTLQTDGQTDNLPCQYGDLRSIAR